MIAGGIGPGSLEFPFTLHNSWERKCAFRVMLTWRQKRTRGEFHMPRFYFHKHLNGQMVPDRSRHFASRQK